MAMNQEANTPVVLTIGGVSRVLILGLMCGTEAWFRSEQRQESDRLWDENPNTWLLDLRGGQLEHVSAAAMEDPKTHARHVPIDVAMKEIVKRNGQLPATQP